VNAKIIKLDRACATGGFLLEIIGKLFGYSQARKTQRYAHLADKAMKVAAAKIGVIHNAGGRR
jgi:hypothetical protein